MRKEDMELLVKEEEKRLGVNSPEFLQRHKEIMELAAEIEKQNRPKKQVYNAKDLRGLLGVSESKAYQYIRQMNKELEEKGFLTVRGKVPVAYVQERFFGVKAGAD